MRQRPADVPPISDLAFRILGELCEEGGQFTEDELFRRTRPSSSFAFGEALKQLHQQYLCAWGFDPEIGACYRVLTNGRMRYSHECIWRGLVKSHA